MAVAAADGVSRAATVPEKRGRNGQRNRGIRGLLVRRKNGNLLHLDVPLANGICAHSDREGSSSLPFPGWAFAVRGDAVAQGELAPADRPDPDG